MRLAPILSILALCAVAAGVFWAAFTYFRADAFDRAEARLSLYQSTVEAELQRFAHLPYLLAQDPFVIATAAGDPPAALNPRLALFAEQAGIDAIYLMDPTGLTIAASNAGTPGSFVGQTYGFRPYFQAAQDGRQGTFYGIGATTGIPGYFYANAVTDAGADVLGVIAIKIDLSALQDSWRQAGERVILTNGDGVSLLSSVPDWRYRALRPLSPAQQTAIQDSRQFGAQVPPPLDWAPAPDGTAVLEGQRFLHLTTSALPNGWSLHYFATDDQARGSAWLATVTLILVAGAGFVGLQVLRNQRLRSALSQLEREEAALRTANTRLAVEIEERRTAQHQLQKTQVELERAGRLAALGQLASSVTHELGQPIAAMRNQLAAAELQGAGTGLTEKLSGLVERMEWITRQLKFFSRKGRDQFETVDLGGALQAALDLLAPNVQDSAVKVTVEGAEEPVSVFANRLRLEQVITNLVRNAIDAVEGEGAPHITLRLGQNTDTAWFEVLDNGHGLGDRSLGDLREPFTTTRESGQGMGLGLTISAGIVDDHGGQMTAENRRGGGARFRVELPRPASEGST